MSKDRKVASVSGSSWKRWNDQGEGTRGRSRESMVVSLHEVGQLSL